MPSPFPRRLGHTVVMMLLIPADVLRPRRPDDHFAAEAEAAAAAGIAVALVDHDALTEPGGAIRAIAKVPDGGGQAVYRGWMLRSSEYRDFAEALAGKGVFLRTGAGQYRQAHELPGWYPALAPITPQSAWTASESRDDFLGACADLGSGPAVLRDYVKSMKHYWDEAAFIPDLADIATAWKVATRFMDLREDDFTGGFVLRRFEQFRSAEVRTWWIDGICRLITAHPDTPEDMPAGRVDLTSLMPLIKGLGLPFVTVDLAQRTDGLWRVIELGDGQVSDRPHTCDPNEFLAATLTTGRSSNPSDGVS